MMKALKKKLMRRHLENQIMIASAVALSGVAVLVLYHILFKVRGAVAEIYYQRKLVKRIDLSNEPEGYFSIPELPKVVFHMYGDGSIAFVRSDCPDQICVETGRLRRPGQIAACLPNEVYIRIVEPGEEIPCDGDDEPYDDAQLSEDTEISGMTSAANDTLIQVDAAMPVEPGTPIEVEAPAKAGWPMNTVTSNEQSSPVEPGTPVDAGALNKPVNPGGTAYLYDT